MTDADVTTLRASAAALSSDYDVALLDLDGVVYVGPAAVPHVPQALAQAREQGMRLAFVTNNAARTPEAVAGHLTELGVAAEPAEVTTSSQAAAHYLADRLPAGSAVLVIGTTGLVEALRERGLTPVDSADADPRAVVQGYSPKLDWAQLAEGAVAIRRGVQWVATNLDPTVPSPRGPLPGNGSMVAALRHATGVTPVATGKPDPTMHRESVERSGATRPIVVGDRLDTDIEGARRVGCASLLVLSGVTTPADLVEAAAHLRPDFLGRDASALLFAHPGVTVEPDGSTAVCNGWVARLGEPGPAGAPTDAGLLVLRGDADGATPDGLDPLRALCALAWAQADDGDGDGDGDRAADSSGSGPRWRVRADGTAAEKAVGDIDPDGTLHG